MLAAHAVLRSAALCPATEGAPQSLVDACVEHLPGCTSAGVALVSARGGVITCTATSEAARRLVSEVRGPVADCLGADDAVLSGDLRADARWPWLSDQDAGEARLIAVPVRCSRNRTALLVLLGPSERSMSDDDVVDAWGVAACAATLLCAADEMTALRGALRNRELVGQAVGLLVERRRLTPRQAFDLLSRASQASNRKVRDLAADMIETGIDLTEAPVLQR